MPYVATYNTRQMPLGRLHLLLGLPRVKSLLILPLRGLGAHARGRACISASCMHRASQSPNPVTNG